VEAFRKALAIDNTDGNAYNALGNSLRILGNLNGATEAFKEAVDKMPNEPAFYLNLFSNARVTANDPRLTSLERLGEHLEILTRPQRISVHFGLGRAYADLGRHEESFDRLLVGNALQRRELLYDERGALELFDRIRTAFTANVIDGMRGHGLATQLPIFIFGMPRSGTTLVEQVLASHPSVAGAGEINCFPGINRTRFDVFPELISTASAEYFKDTGSRYVELLAAKGTGQGRVTDKTCGNFYYAGLIHLALPNARMIHVTRNKIDTCLSCFSTLFGAGNLRFTYDLAELSRYYDAYNSLMEHWRSVLPPTAILEVNYETLVADFRKEVKRILEYCELCWDEACLSFHKTDRPVATASATQVRQPLYTTSVRRWRPHEDIIRPLLSSNTRSHPHPESPSTSFARMSA
jgi:tetratricopeptide (TPR) repeat protein